MSIEVSPLATAENFEESAYLKANPDVRQVVEHGMFVDGRDHFRQYGWRENRRLLLSPDLSFPRRRKLERLRPHLRADMPCTWDGDVANYLTPELRAFASVDETSNVSSNNYDPHIVSLIETHDLVLDCGAGFRSIYYPNVVNFEIAAYTTTDILGVGEQLPFQDNSFDVVLSIAVLEHVRYPWICAKEIVRVLKPGGTLVAMVPFLQPLHGYPHHFFNMTQAGLASLFEKDLQIHVHVPEDPIVSFPWMLRMWADNLPPAARDQFLNLSIRQLIRPSPEQAHEPYVRELSEEGRWALACTTKIVATKP